MRKLFFILSLSLVACVSNEKKSERLPFTEVVVETVYEDSISIRAIEVMGNAVGFAGSDGHYGIYYPKEGKVMVDRLENDSLSLEFRAVASTSNDFFMLSVANPAHLYKTGDNGQMELVYSEEHERVFYDAMTFWNEKEGIAMGDPTENCISIIVTRDGGSSWKKLPCEVLPEAIEGEVAFAASDSNIAVAGDHTWIITGGSVSRILYSPNKGKSWEVFETPIISGEATTGGYTIDFYDEKNGIIFGGDYSKPDGNLGNKAITQDGGKTWSLVADGQDPGYKSSVRYVPGGKAQEIVATGFTGINYSSDGGKNWKELSKEGFYTLRFLNDSVAVAAGKNRLARLRFR